MLDELYGSAALREKPGEQNDIWIQVSEADEMVVKETNMYPLITKEEYEQLMKQIKEETLLAKNNLFLVKVNLAIQIALLVIWSYTLWRLLQQ